MNEFIKKFGLFCSAVAIVTVSFVAGMRYVQPALEDTSRQEAAITETFDGIIVDKKIENPHSNWFRTTSTEYRLYINVDYFSDGEKKTVKKYFSVPESTYLAYDIGDYFNSHNFSFSDEQ